MRNASLLFISWLMLTGVTLRAETAFWVWQRGEPLSSAERATLSTADVRTLYWQVGEVRQIGGVWRTSVRYPMPVSTTSLQMIPVLRLVSNERSPFSAEAQDSLRAEIAAVASGNTLLQLDYDCPDRLLAEYAAFLRRLRADGKSISITALAGWCSRPEWADLQHSVVEMAPMFYDLRPDPPLDRSGAPCLLDAAEFAADLRAWEACAVPWRVGLPSFARVTIYTGAGRPNGHLRAWNWDDLCFSKLLESPTSTQDGVTTLKVKSTGSLAEAAIAAGETVAVRWPDRAALAQAERAATKTTARGVIFFRLPDGTAAGGWSIPQLANLGALPKLTLEQVDATHFELRNIGSGDLPPRPAGRDAHDRGYAVELDAGAPLFREAEEGNFWRLGSHVVAPDGKATAAAVPLATRLTFWFSQLRAGEMRRTGLIRLAPSADFRQLRYRILGDQTDPPWQNLPSFSPAPPVH